MKSRHVVRSQLRVPVFNQVFLLVLDYRWLQNPPSYCYPELIMNPYQSKILLQDYRSMLLPKTICMLYAASHCRSLSYITKCRPVRFLRFFRQQCSSTGFWKWGILNSKWLKGLRSWVVLKITSNWIFMNKLRDDSKKDQSEVETSSDGTSCGSVFSDDKFSDFLEFIIFHD